MKCIPDSQLRAYVDDETARAERELIQQHLAACKKCAQRADAIAGRSAEVQSRLAALNSETEEPVDTSLAYSRYQTSVAGRAPVRTPYRPAWLNSTAFHAAAVAAVIALVLSFAPVRSWGQRFLEMLRIQKLAVVPIDTSTINKAGLEGGRNRAWSQLVSDSMVVTMRPAEAVTVTDIETASAQAGFHPQTLNGLGSPRQIRVEGEGAFHMTLDADRIRAVLEEAGRTDIQIPDSVDGGIVAVHVAKGVEMEYGSCGPNTAGDDCIRFRQVPMPSVSVPPNMNMTALAEAALQLTGMSAMEAKTFAQTVDWSSTLVIPVPRDKATYENVSVDGVNGTLIERMSGRGAYDLIWLKNGILHSVSGDGGPDRALSAVAALGS